MAVTITAATLRGELGLADDPDGNATAGKLLNIAKALAEKEGATEAPDDIANEAVVLTAAHVKERFPGAMQSIDLPTITIRLRETGSPVRLSGARALLSPWRVRDLPVEPED